MEKFSLLARIEKKKRNISYVLLVDLADIKNTHRHKITDISAIINMTEKNLKICSKYRKKKIVFFYEYYKVLNCLRTLSRCRVNLKIKK